MWWPDGWLGWGLKLAIWPAAVIIVLLAFVAL